MSFLFHTVLFVLIFLALHSFPRGSGQLVNRTGGIVLVDISSESTEYLSEGDVESSPAESTADQSPPPLSATQERPPELPGLAIGENSTAGAGEALAEMLPGAESLVDVPTGSVQLGGKVTTEVFGVTGTGSRFVYVFDRSQSMMGYQARPLIAAKQALLKSLESLGSNHQFQIIFYNDGVRILNHDAMGTLYFATDENKSAAHDFIASIQGQRGTDHIKALKQAFRFGPDVIFFLTDAEGGFTKAELNLVSELNRSAAIINAIEFGERRGSDRSLEQLAIDSGGQYVFKNIRTLRLQNQ